MTGRTERFRQRHVAPVTWEWPTLLALIVLAAVAAVPLAVQAGTGLVTSGRWAWPAGHVLEAATAIASGRFGAGLSAADRRSLPSPSWLWTFTAVGELLVMLTVAIVYSGFRHVGAWSGHGLAGRAEARRALGSKALRRRAPVVRPDLPSSLRSRALGSLCLHRWSAAPHPRRERRDRGPLHP